jgi:hypothetical protein
MSTGYLPDFVIPAELLILEVKGTERPSAEDQELLARTARAGDRSGWQLTLWAQKWSLVHPKARFSLLNTFESGAYRCAACAQWRWRTCPTCGDVGYSGEHREPRLVRNPALSVQWETCPLWDTDGGVRLEETDRLVEDFSDVLVPEGFDLDDNEHLWTLDEIEAWECPG